MAGKKKEGIDALKEISGGKRRDDRNACGKTYFDPITVDAKNALTVIYLLQSPEDEIVLRAIVSLEAFGKKDPENLMCLCSLGISQFLFPLIDHKDLIVRRFTLKLIGMLSKLEDFQKELLQLKNVLEIFNSILTLDSDTHLQEFSSLTLANLTTKYIVASDYLKLETSIDTLFIRIISPDPDIEKNCLDIMNHLLNDINGIETFIEADEFKINPIIDLIFSSYPVIQALALEVLMQLTSWCRDTRILFAFRDAEGIERVLTVLEKEEWDDLHSAAVQLLLNVTDNPEICDYLHQSGCLSRFINLLDNITKVSILEKMLGVLARMSQSIRARPVLHALEIEKRFLAYLQESSECLQEVSCMGIANQSQYYPSLDVILCENPIPSLIAILVNSDKNYNLRKMAAYTLNILSNTDQRVIEILMENDNFEVLVLLLTQIYIFPTELSQNLIQVFMAICSIQQFRVMAISDKFLSALISSLSNPEEIAKVDVSLQVDIIDCLSGFLVEPEARVIFDCLNGAQVTLNCLRSKYAAVREWAGHLVIVASQSQDFLKSFLKMNGLIWMLKEKNTMYSMPSWQSAIETIFSNFLPAKFAFTGRIDIQDITQDNFYILAKPNAKFVLLDYFFEEKISPVIPLYVANFCTPIETTEMNASKILTTSQNSIRQSLENADKFMKGTDKTQQEDIILDKSINTHSSFESCKIDQEVGVNIENYLPDNNLRELLENLKKKIIKEEPCLENKSWTSIYRILICERARIIAEFVADEMSGPEPDPICTAQYKKIQFNELRHFLGSNIIPLGLIRMGDYLERAMLFKVLADRIGFSCALVRGSYGRAWIEIAVPLINIEESEDDFIQNRTKSMSLNSETKSSCETMPTTNTAEMTCELAGEMTESQSEVKITENSECDYWFPSLKIKNFKGFPDQYLKTNAIVDLINYPGRILKINSYEAKEYCGMFLYDNEENT